MGSGVGTGANFSGYSGSPQSSNAPQQTPPTSNSLGTSVRASQMPYNSNYGPSMRGRGPYMGGYGPSMGGYGPSMGGYGPSMGGFGAMDRAVEPSVLYPQPMGQPQPMVQNVPFGQALAGLLRGDRSSIAPTNPQDNDAWRLAMGLPPPSNNFNKGFNTPMGYGYGGPFGGGYGGGYNPFGNSYGGFGGYDFNEGGEVK